MSCTDTFSQNGRSRSKHSHQEYHGDTSNISARRDGPHTDGSSSSQLSTSHKLVLKPQGRDGAKCQSRDVLLNLLQPPGLKVTHVQQVNCTLPHQDSDKILYKPDLYGSYCMRCTNFHQAARSPIDRRRKMIREWNQGAWYNASTSLDTKTHEQNLSINRETRRGHFDDHEMTTSFPCPGEHLLRTNTTKTDSLSAAVNCQERGKRRRPHYQDELPLHKDLCQNVASYHQKRARQDCFKNDTYTNDPKVPLHEGGNIDDKIMIGVDTNSNNDGPKYIQGSNWHLESRHSLKSKHPISEKKLAHDQPEKGVTSSSNCTVVAQVSTENGNDAFNEVYERTHPRPPSTSQDDRLNHNMSPTNSYRHEKFRTPSKLESSPVKSPSGPEHHHEEKGFEKPSESDNQALHHSSLENSQESGSQSDECTPVIVQCYSLSVLPPALQSTTMKGSQFLEEKNADPSVNIGNDFVRDLPGPLRCSYHRGSPERRETICCGLESHNDNPYCPPVNCPRSSVEAHNDRQDFIVKPKRPADQLPTSKANGLDGQNLPSREISSTHPHTRCTWHHNHQTFKSGRGRRQDHGPWIKPQVKTSPSFSDQETSRFQVNRSSMYDDQESKETSPIWYTKHLQHRDSRALEIHDYYEERRILVEKVCQHTRGSEEDIKCNQNLTSTYECTRQFGQTDHNQASTSGAEVHQTPVYDESAFQVCSHQRENAVGSRKRKSRPPRPQRLRAHDLHLAKETHQHEDSQLEVRHKDFSCSEYVHQERFPCQLEGDTSVSKERCEKRRGIVRVYGNGRKIYSQEDTDLSQQHSPRRHDYVFQRNSPTQAVCSNDFPLRKYPSRRPSFPDRRNTDPSSENYAQFVEFPRNPRVVSPRELEAAHKQAEFTPYQTKSPNKHLPNLNATRSSFDNGCNGVTPQHRHGPIWIIGPEGHLEHLEKICSGYDRLSVGQCDLACNAHGERHGYHLDHPAVSAKGKAPNKPSETQPSSPGDKGCDSSNRVEDTFVPAYNKSFTSVETSVTTDAENEKTQKRNESFSEDHTFFIHTREVLTDCTAPTTKEKRFVCRYCSKKFAHFSTLQNHLRTHTGDKPFQCSFCGRRFAQSGVLKAHLRTHTGDKPFACMYCGKVFAQSTTLTNHLRTHTGHKPYICNYCGKSFSQPSTLRKHELSHTKERPYPCKFCGKAFAQQSTLTNHMRSHTGQRPYKCRFCEKSFAQLSTLDRHLRLHSSVSLKPHQCQYCNKSFSYISNLASHMRNHEREMESCQ